MKVCGLCKQRSRGKKWSQYRCRECGDKVCTHLATGKNSHEAFERRGFYVRKVDPATGDPVPLLCTCRARKCRDAVEDRWRERLRLRMEEIDNTKESMDMEYETVDRTIQATSFVGAMAQGKWYVRHTSEEGDTKMTPARTRATARRIAKALEARDGGKATYDRIFHMAPDTENGGWKESK